MIKYKDRPLFGRINSALADPRFMFLSLLLLGLGCISTAVVIPPIVEVEFRKQCANRDWPLHQDQAHVDDCHAEGHAVGKLGPGF